MKKALITGVLGQDGSYLAQYLVERLGYEVHGVCRGPAAVHENFVSRVTYHYGDLRDEASLETVIKRVLPDEIYNLGGQVFVPTSWRYPELTFDVNVGGLTRILKLVELLCPDCHIYQASSSEMFGNVNGTSKMSELSPMHPVSPYGVSKLAAHRIVSVYRDKGLYVVAGILFNHESPRRGPEMVTRKITKQVARWAAGHENEILRLGNPDSRRDWGFAGDYVKAMHAMLQQREADDYVVGTGESHSVKEFLLQAIQAAHLPYEKFSSKIVYNAAGSVRPNELTCLTADYGKAHQILKWSPSTPFTMLVRQMVNCDMSKETQEMQPEKVCASQAR